MSSPYHYPEGPRSNIPFNPLTKWFALRYWGFMAVGFGELSKAARDQFISNLSQVLHLALQFGRHTRTNRWQVVVSVVWNFVVVEY